MPSTSIRNDSRPAARTTPIGAAAREDEMQARAAHYETQAMAAMYPGLLCTLFDLYTGRGCEPVTGNARMIVEEALQRAGRDRIFESSDLELVELPSGDFAWLRKEA